MTTLAEMIGPLIELADLGFAAAMDALEVTVDAGEVTAEVTGEVSVAEVETLSDLEEVGSIDESYLADDEISLSDETSSLGGDTTGPIDDIPEAPPEEMDVQPYEINDAPLNETEAPAFDDFTPEAPNNTENLTSVHSENVSIFQNEDGSITSITVDENGNLTITDFANEDDYLNSICDDYAGLPDENIPEIEAGPSNSNNIEIKGLDR